MLYIYVENLNKPTDSNIFFLTFNVLEIEGNNKHNECISYNAFKLRIINNSIYKWASLSSFCEYYDFGICILLILRPKLQSREPEEKSIFAF